MSRSKSRNYSRNKRDFVPRASQLSLALSALSHGVPYDSAVSWNEHISVPIPEADLSAAWDAAQSAEDLFSVLRKQKRNEALKVEYARRNLAPTHPGAGETVREGHEHCAAAKTRREVLFASGRGGSTNLNYSGKKWRRC